jgi:hypothetical protein
MLLLGLRDSNLDAMDREARDEVSGLFHCCRSTIQQAGFFSFLNSAHDARAAMPVVS